MINIKQVVLDFLRQYKGVAFDTREIASALKVERILVLRALDELVTEKQVEMSPYMYNRYQAKRIEAP